MPRWLSFFGLVPDDPAPNAVMARYARPEKVPPAQWEATPELVADNVRKLLRNVTGLCPGVPAAALLELISVELAAVSSANPECPTCGKAAHADPR